MPNHSLLLRVILTLEIGLFSAGVICPALAAPHATDHILVKFKPEVREHLGASSRAANLEQLRAALGLPSGAELIEPPLHDLLPALPAGQAGGTRPDLSRFFYLRLPPGLSVEDGVRRVAKHPWVDYAEPDGIGTGGGIPDDPSFARQWHHRNVSKPSASIQTPLAWDLTTGSTNVIIAVLDSGLTVSPEFSGRVLPGFNFVTNSADTADDHGHGTAVSGTLAASGNNATLVAGVDWQCRLLPVKVLDSNNNGYYSWWAEGIDFAVSRGARVINLSAGGSGSSSTLTTAIRNAIASGVIFVTITHNDGTDVVRYPGRLPECITVGATDALDRRAGFSNFGPEIDLCAPGTNIATVGRSGSLETWWGTSFAAPQVAGVCGLLLSLRPELNQEAARALLCLGAEDQVGGATDVPGFDVYHGWGRLNAYHSALLAGARLRAARGSNGFTELSWPSPSNASNRQPFQVEFRDGLTGPGPWTTNPETLAFRYTTNRTYWADTNSLAGPRFYRLRLRTLP